MPLFQTKNLFALLPAAAVVFFFALPSAAAILPGLRGIWAAAQERWLWQVTAWTFTQAAASTALALALGLPAAYAVSSPNFRYKRAVRALCAVPFALPPILMALGFVLFWGNSGIVNRIFGAALGVETPLRVLYSPFALIFCHACYNFPIIMRFAGDSFAKIRQNYSATAWVMGANPRQTAFFIALPLALPAIFAASMLIFLYCWTSFAIVLLLGGPGQSTLAIEIFRFARVSLDFSTAGALSLIETSVAAVIFALYCAFDRKINHNNDGGSLPPRYSPPPQTFGLLRAVFRYPPLLRELRPLKIPCTLLPAFLVIAPIAAIAASSFFGTQSRASAAVFTLSNYTASPERLLAALARSIILAALSAVIATTLAFLAAEALSQNEQLKRDRRGGAFRALMTLPAASSGIVLGFGIIALYGRSLSRTAAMAAAAQAVIALPFAFNSVYEALRALPVSLRGCAAVFGATPLRRMIAVDMPLIAAALRSAFAFSVCISLGELNTILMLGIEKFETLPLFIYRAAGAYRHGEAAAAGTILILCSFFALVLSGKKD